MLDVAQPLNDRKLIHQNRIEVARVRVIKQARLFERVNDRDLESELLDRLDDARVVVKGVDEEDSTAGMGDERLLTDGVEVPFSDAAAGEARVSTMRRGREKSGEEGNSPLNREVELRTATELRRDPKLAAHELYEPLRDCGETSRSTSIEQQGEERRRDALVNPNPVPPYFLVVDPSACANVSKMRLSLSGLMPIPVSEMQNSSWYVFSSRSAA